MEIKSEEKIKLCALCFRFCDDNFDVLQDEKKEMLELLLFKLDVSPGEEQIICMDCASNLEVSFGFKSTCLTSENYIKSFLNDASESKMDLIKVYLNKTENKDTVNVPEGCAVCRLCIGLVHYGSWISLDDEDSDTGSEILKLLTHCLPEINLNITQDPVICTSCHKSLAVYLDLMKNCPEFEEMYSLKQNSSKPVLSVTLNSALGHEVYVTEPKFEKGEDVGESNDQILVDNGTQDQEVMEMRAALASITSTDSSRPLSRENSAPPKPGYPLYSCDQCTYITNFRHNLKRHQIVHQDATNLVMHRCEFCSFTTKHKNCLKAHAVIHQDASEITMHQCQVCGYRTKYKRDLKKHSLLHQSDLQVPIYRCASCEYKTRHKSSLRKHVALHKHAGAGVEAYSCDSCGYKTNTQYDLDLHSLVHNQSLKYRCKDCDFQTNQKKELDKHVKVHRAPSEASSFHCAECKFTTKYKRNLRKHMVLHQESSSMTMYRCEVCEFETKHKFYMKRHALVHWEASEWEMYACDMCNYKAKRKQNLNEHKARKHNTDKNENNREPND